jgi:hypothetical protein
LVASLRSGWVYFSSFSPLEVSFIALVRSGALADHGIERIGKHVPWAAVEAADVPEIPGVLPSLSESSREVELSLG